MLTYESVGIGCLCALAWYLFRLSFGNPMRRIPGPRELPILGSLLSIKWPEFHLQLSEWRSIYGPVIKLTLLGENLVIISSAEAAKEALVSRGLDFAGRPSMWRTQRAFFFKAIGSETFTPALVEKKKVMLNHLKAVHSDGCNRLERILMDEMNEFLERISGFQGQPIQAKSETATFINNIWANMAYGERYASNHPLVKAIRQMNQDVMDNACINSSGKELDTYPWLRFTGLFSKGMENLRRLETLRDSVFLERVKRERESFDPSNSRGLIDDLISRSQNGSDVMSRITWNDEHIVSYLLEIFAAGTETSLNTLQAAYLILLKHSELQTRIQQEINCTIGNDEPSIKHRSSMPFTEAFILELLRYTSIAPLMLPHMTLKDTSVGGYFVPASTRVIINSWDVHHNEQIYPKPFEFRPERFLDEQGKIRSHDHPSRTNFLAFGAGRRSCPGEQFALARVFLLIVSLLQRFTLKKDEARPAPDPDPRTYRMSLVLDVPECFFIASARK